jgi:guanylate kinase
VLVFILPPSMAELERRLRRRATDSPEAIARRLAMATKELEHFAQYDYLVVNDNLETALKELSSIYVAARCARGRRGHYGQMLLHEATARDAGGGGGGSQ